MEIERAREDAVVAASAGGTTIAIALLSGFVSVIDVDTLPTLIPLAVYAVYLFSRKGGPYGTYDTPQNWVLIAMLSGVVVVVLSSVL